MDAPVVRPAPVIEDEALIARDVPGNATPHFDAFLDGAQLTLVAHWEGMIPVVHGTMSAVVRQRRERRLTTWRAPIVRRAVYAPVKMLDTRVASAIDALGVEVVDTLLKKDADSVHPFALQEIAYQAVLAERERVESELARQWVEREQGALFIDGSITGDSKVAKASQVVGVIKSHQTLHLDAESLPMLSQLAVGRRTSVFRVESGRRPAVASWYLRSASPTGHDPFWGLVRVEVANTEAGAAITQRADEVSRWVLAERFPLALPDWRWDKMAYGIRDAEEYLRAVQ